MSLDCSSDVKLFINAFKTFRAKRYLGQVIGQFLNLSPLLADDVLVQPGRAVYVAADDRVGLLVHLGQGQAELLLRSSQSDGLAGRVRSRHLDEDARIGQNLVDGVALGPDNVLVLTLFHFNADLAELFFPGIQFSCLKTCFTKKRLILKPYFAYFIRAQGFVIRCQKNESLIGSSHIFKSVKN
jgi:hypothetical protein